MTVVFNVIVIFQEQKLQEGALAEDCGTKSTIGDGSPASPTLGFYPLQFSYTRDDLH